MLHDLFTAYRNGTMGRKTFENRMFKHLITRYYRYRLTGLGRDGVPEFLCWLYPRLHRAIDTFTPMGVSFDAYIQTILHCSLRDYRQQDHRYAEECLYWELHAIADTPVSTAPVLDAPRHHATPIQPKQPAPNASLAVYWKDLRMRRIPVQGLPAAQNIPVRFIIIVLLKSYSCVSDRLLLWAANVIDIPVPVLTNLMDRIRQCRRAEDQRYQEAHERVQRQYFRCLFFMKRLTLLPSGSIPWLDLQYKLARAQKRLKNMRHRLSRMRRQATNKQVADVLGISKGTVDSNLARLKKRLRVLDPALLERGLFPPPEDE